MSVKSKKTKKTDTAKKMNEKNMDKQLRSIPIAVVGISSFFPGSSDLRGFWHDIVDGNDQITEVPPSHFLIEDFYDPDPFAPDKTYCKTGAFLKPVEFDPMEYGLPPKNIETTDTSQLLALIAAKQVLDDATQGQFSNMDRSKVSVILGVAAGLELLGEMACRLGRPQWVKALREEGIPEEEVIRICDRIANEYVPWKESTFPGLLGNVVAGRIANHFDLGGTNCTSDAACASSFSAMSMALNELYLGQSDLVITGGVDTNNDPLLYVSFSKTPALSRTGDCRPFADNADGMVLGEGIGMVALKRLEDAERDGDKIYAVIKGMGTSSDGSGTSVYAPVAEGQTKALRRAYEAAGYTPDTVELMEAHGTGTAAGDVAEFKGLKTVFEENDRGDRQWCALGSIKSQIGHTKSTAAAAGLIKSVMALHHKILPPTIKVDRPDPKLEIEKSPFYLNTKARPWIRGNHHPRRASVSSFGFGGTNYHVTLEEYKGTENHAYRIRTVPTELIVLSAENASSLESLCRKTAEDLNTEGMITYLARTTQENYDNSQPARISLIASDETDLEKKLIVAADIISKKPDTEFNLPDGTGYNPDSKKTGKLAFLFPGQGSQYVNMGADLAMQFNNVQEIWDLTALIPRDDTELEKFLSNKSGTTDSSEADHSDHNTPVSSVNFPIPVFSKEDIKKQSHTLMQTQWSQPAILTTSLTMSYILKSIGIEPEEVGGHSLGEITALFDSGILDVYNLLKVSMKRALLMAEAAKNLGSMTAVINPPDKSELNALLKEWNSDVIIANYNSPKQLVLSGPTPSIEKVEPLLDEKNIKYKRLHVPVAFHSSIMSESCEPFLQYMQSIKFNKPEIPVYSCVTGKPHSNDTKTIQKHIADQLDNPVRFIQMLDSMYESGVRTFVEVGPSNILTKLVGQCLEGKPHAAINLDSRHENGITSLWKALGRLALSGISIDFSLLWKDFAPANDPRLKKKPKFSVSLLGTNYNNPYPPEGGAKALPKPNPPRKKEVVKEISHPIKTTSWQQGKISTQQNIKKDIDIVAKPAHPLQQLPAEDIQRTNAPIQKQPTATINSANQNSWISAFQKVQRQTAETHSVFQKNMADTHMAFLKSVEDSSSILNTMISGNIPEKSISHQPTKSPQAQPFPKTPVAAREINLPPSTPTITSHTPHVKNIVKVSEPVLQKVFSPATDKPVENLQNLHPAPPVLKPAEPQKAETAGTVDFQEMLLSVVSDKTGYPKNILNLDMGLESDLGIDSIKRVEIFSAVKDENPWLPEVDAGLMAEIQTLDDVLNYINPSLEAINSGGNASSSVSQDTKSTSPAVEQPDDSNKLGRFTLKEVIAPYSGFSTKGLYSADPVIITDDETGVAQELVKILKENGIKAEIHQEIPENADTVIFLGGLRETANIQDTIDINKEAFLAANKIADRLTTSGGIFITVQNTGGDFGLSGRSGNNIWLGGLSGLVKTAAIEWPDAFVKSIDIERGKQSAKKLADAICKELLSGGPEIEVGLHADGTRTRMESCSEPVKNSNNIINNDDVIVASGGAKGVTARTLIELARHSKPKFVLLGRTPLTDEPACCLNAKTDGEIKRSLLENAKSEGKTVIPAELGNMTNRILSNREILSTIKNIKNAGSEIKYVTADVQNVNDIESTLKSIRKEWGPITGIVHGAGVLFDKLIAEKTTEQFDRVFNTKVKGLQTLLSATAEDPLNFICLFSSIAARCGNMGQCDYAMANEILNKVAASESIKRKGKCVVKSINWGPWDGGMVSPLLKAHFQEMGIPLIPLDKGSKIFVEEITEANPENIEIVIGPTPPSGGLSMGSSNKEMDFSVKINSNNYPFIDSHQIKDRPVVPVALVLEWFSRAAQLFNPDMTYVACKELKVLRGIQINDFHNLGQTISLSCRQVSNGDGSKLNIELPDANGISHFSAVIEMAENDTVISTPQIKPVEGLEPWSWTISDIYETKLFHGPEFQVIKSLEGISNMAATVILDGADGMSWPGGDSLWKTDTAALDGGLQLAILWGIHRIGKKSLPTKIGAYYSHHEGFINGPVRCELKGTHIGTDRSVSDILFFDVKGKLMAELRDVEMHMLSDTGINYSSFHLASYYS